MVTWHTPSCLTPLALREATFSGGAEHHCPLETRRRGAQPPGIPQPRERRWPKIYHRIQNDPRASQQDPSAETLHRRAWQTAQSASSNMAMAMEGQAGRNHTPPLNVEMAGGWEARGGERSKPLARTWPTVFWSLTRYCRFLSTLPCRQHETSLQVEQGCVHQLVANYMGNAGPPG